MKRHVLAFCAALLWLASHGQLWAQAKPSVLTRSPAKETISADEQLLRQSVTKFVELYNAHKAKEISQLFAPDARVVFRDGTEVNGRDEIAKSFETAFADSPKAAISVVVESFRFLTPDVAIEEGYTSDFPDGETQTALSRYIVMHVKKNGSWAMQAVRTEEEESLSAYRDLQPLEWLIGDWVDEGRTENVQSHFRWDENKSFLLEEFEVVREGAVVLKGTQRIGWDPQAKQIRSWIFDNAGGFAEATWALVDDAWVVKTKGVSPDGTSTSATRILRRAANDRVLWTSQDRIAGNESLPDLTVTMVRQAPPAK